MSFSKVNTPILALILSVVAELVFYTAYSFLGTTTPFGTPSNFWSRSFWWFHILGATWCYELGVKMLPGWIAESIADAFGWALVVGLAVFQWYVLWLPCVALVRRLSRRSDENLRVEG